VVLVGLLASWTISMSPGGSATYAPRRLSVRLNFAAAVGVLTDLKVYGACTAP
jgi:hypothetical protein